MFSYRLIILGIFCFVIIVVKIPSPFQDKNPYLVVFQGINMQGVSGSGKPGKVIELHFSFSGLEKSWKLSLGFGKFIKSHRN